MRAVKKTDPRAAALTRALKKASWEHEAPIWRDIAKRLERPRRSWSEVNVGQIDRVCKDGESIIVPGKVLGAGAITKKVTVGAYGFSRSAEEKIRASGGKVLAIEDMLKANPKGKGLRVIG